MMDRRSQRITKLLYRSKPLAHYVLIFLIFTLPRLGNLGQYVTADEPMYLREAGGFYYALTNQRFDATLRDVAHPGVTTLWVGALGYLIGFPVYGSQGELYTADLRFDRLFQKYQIIPLQILVYSRGLLVLLNACLMAISFYFAQRMLGGTAALVGFVLLALDPFMFAHGRLLGVDGLLASFLLLSLLALLNFTYQLRKIDLVFSSLAAGLSWLTKTTGLIIVPLAVCLFFYEAWHQPGRKSAQMFRFMKYLGLWLGLGVLIFFILYPAMWANPLRTLTRLASFTLESASGKHSSNSFFDGQLIPNGLIGWEYFYFYPYTFLWRTTPVIVLGLIALIFFWRNHPDYPQRRSMWWFVVFTLLFTVLMTISAKKFDRYLTPVYPPLIILAGIGWMRMASFIIRKKSGKLVWVVGYGILTISVAWQVITVWQSIPYPLAYYNPLMGGGSRAPTKMQIGWGEGLDEAARFLNMQPDIEKKKVYSWYASAINYHLYKITKHLIARSLPISQPINDVQFADMVNADFAVIYIHQWQRQNSARLLAYLSDKEPIFTVTINEINYVQIYDLTSFR